MSSNEITPNNIQPVSLAPSDEIANKAAGKVEEVALETLNAQQTTSTSPYSAKPSPEVDTTVSVIQSISDTLSPADSVIPCDPSAIDGFLASRELTLFTKHSDTHYELRMRSPFNEILIFTFKKTKFKYTDLESQKSFKSLMEIEEFYTKKEVFAHDYYKGLQYTNPILMHVCRKVVNLIAENESTILERMNTHNIDSRSLGNVAKDLNIMYPSTSGQRFANEETQVLYRHKIRLLGEGSYKSVYEKITICFSKNVFKKVAEAIFRFIKPHHEDLYFKELEIQRLFRGIPQFLQIFYAFKIRSKDDANRKGIMGTELCVGSLDKLADLTPEQKKYAACEILRALIVMDRKEIVHRDLALKNILWGVDNHVKIADFGLAIYMTDQDAVNKNLATPSSIAPEILRNHLLKDQETCTTATDMYSVGILLFKLLQGSTWLNQIIKENIHRWRTTGDQESLIHGITEIGTFYACMHVKGLRFPLYSLLSRMIAPDPTYRIKPAEALRLMEELPASEWVSKLE